MLFADIFKHTGDLDWLRRAYAALNKEYAFWMALRLAPNGLNTCGTHADPVTLANFYDVISHRLSDIPADPVARLQYLRHKMAECEVWDFNPRFDQRATDHNPVDTNAILFQFETIAGDFARTLGLAAEETVWRERAAHRRSLIDQYLWHEARGFYFDYDWAHGRPGSVVSAAPYFALWAGACTAAQAAALAREILPLVRSTLTASSPAPKAATPPPTLINGTHRMPGPHCRPPQIMGLLRYGYTTEAKRLAEKYVLTCARNLETTGKLWEKIPTPSPATSMSPTNTRCRK